MQASDKPIDATELAAAIAESARIEAAMRPGSSQPIEQERLYRARGRARLVERQRLRGLSMAQLEAQAAQRP